MSPETTQALLAGQALFNARKFFEAHEAWESAWRQETGETRALIQGLILVAAACHKATLNEPRGAVKLLLVAVDKLDDVPSLADFRSRALTALDEAEAWNAGRRSLWSPELRLDEDLSHIEVRGSADV